MSHRSVQSLRYVTTKGGITAANYGSDRLNSRTVGHAHWQGELESAVRLMAGVDVRWLRDLGACPRDHAGPAASSFARTAAKGLNGVYQKDKQPLQFPLH